MKNAHEIVTSKKNDFIYAILYYFYVLLLTFLFAKFIFSSRISDSFKILININTLPYLVINIIFVIVLLLPLFIYIFINKEPLSSIGIIKEGIIKSFINGILTFIFLIVLNTLINTVLKLIINHSFEVNLNISIENKSIYSFIYFLFCIAFSEEIIFRGFIQCKIKGIVKNFYLSNILVGIMFGSEHIIFRYYQYTGELSAFIQTMILQILGFTLYHFILMFCYQKSKNIIAPIITHFLCDYFI
jgi:uncharacterized protein